MTTYSQGPSEEDDSTITTYATVRLDMPDPSDPETAALFIYGLKMGMKFCSFEGYNKYSSLYHDMDYDYKYFTEPFEYDSKDDNAKCKGNDCKSYVKQGYESNTTIYADENNIILGITHISGSRFETFNVKKYDYSARTSDFEVSGIGCEAYPKARGTLEKDATCAIKDIAVSTEVSILALILAAMISFFTLF